MSATNVADDAAISLRQAIDMQTAKAIELWLDVVDDPAERASLAAMIRAWSLGVGPQSTLTVRLTVAAIVRWSAWVSSILPLGADDLRHDRASDAASTGGSVTPRFGLAAGLDTVIDVQRVLLLGSRDGV